MVQKQCREILARHCPKCIGFTLAGALEGLSRRKNKQNTMVVNLLFPVARNKNGGMLICNIVSILAKEFTAFIGMMI